MTDPLGGAQPPSAVSRYSVVALGGVVGTLLRYGQGALVTALVPGPFPWGTFTINLLGTLALAAFLAALLETERAHPLWRPFFAVGFCGGYTTFSAFENELLALVQKGSLDVAIAYALASVVASLIVARLVAKLVRGTARGREKLVHAPPLVLAPAVACAIAVVAVVGLGRLEPSRLETLPLAALAVAVGGSVGSIARYGVAARIFDALPSLFPWATLVINVTGSLLIGFFEGATSVHAGAPAILRPLLVTGFLGGYTTFSTFAQETAFLVEQESRKLAFVYASASVLGGFGAAFLGRYLGSLV